MSEENFTQRDVENKQLKEGNEKLRKENENQNENENENENKNENENEQFKKNIVKDANIKDLIEEPKEIKSPNWFDKNKFKKLLTIIASNIFGYKNKIDEFKYIDIKDLVNNIRNNTISEIDAKKSLNALNKTKNVEIKYKTLTPKQKELLNLFNYLSDTILTYKTLMSSKDKNEKKKKKENGNRNDETLML